MRSFLTLRHGLTALVVSSLASAASLVQVNGWGDNPGNAQMFIAVPSNLAANPAIVVCMHPCGGSAQQYYSSNSLGTTYADRYGYIAIFPQVTHDFNCWDAATTATLTHNGGSDSLSIVNMVKYTISKYNADSSRVYMTGSSSGAIMTNVLGGAYPDVFAAGAAFAGMPYGCLKGSPGSSPMSADPACANGQVSKTGAQWASLVHQGYPGYTGSYPRMQMWHGTADSVINYNNFVQELAEWSTVLGVSFSHNVTNSPQSGYTKMVYGDGTKLVGYSAAGVGHFPPTNEQVVLDFFGIPGGGSATTGQTAQTTPTSPTTTRPTTIGPITTPASGGATQTHWGQCGGMGWTGPTNCSPYTCSTMNPYYAQCL